MKRCTQCGQTYNDGSLNFCLMDGAPLVETDSEPTVVIGGTASSVPTVTSAGEPPPGLQSSSAPPPAGTELSPPIHGNQWEQIQKPARRGSKMFLWVGLLILVILLGGGAFVGLLIYYAGHRDQTRVNLPGNVNSSSSPRHSTTPRPSPSPAQTPASSPVGESSPVKEDSDQNAGSDEITPIVWDTSAAGFKSEVGMTYRFECPPNGKASAVWGSDVYTADSSICTAAVHAGKITLEDGGVVTIEFRPGRKIYGSTVRNGITSSTFGEYPQSIVFK